MENHKLDWSLIHYALQNGAGEPRYHPNPVCLGRCSSNRQILPLAGNPLCVTERPRTLPSIGEEDVPGTLAGYDAVKEESRLRLSRIP